MFYELNTFRFVSWNEDTKVRHHFNPWAGSSLGVVGKYASQLRKIEVAACTHGRIHRLTINGGLADSKLEIMRAGDGCRVNSRNLARGQDYLEMAVRSAGPSAQLTDLQLGVLIYFLEVEVC